METAIVLGTFDGLHEGHRAVIERAKGYYTVAVTFDVPPKSFLNGKQELLMSSEDKNQGLIDLGVNEVFSLDFSKVRNMRAEEFFCLLKEKFSPLLIVCGFNYRFGAKAEGDCVLLSDLCAENKIEFCSVSAVGGNEPISSSSLRKLISNGDIYKANRHIYGGFGFTSEVVHGDARGKTFGFPTANQIYPDNLVRPLFGVYKSKIMIDGEKYDGVTNIGLRPTYKTDYIGCETFIKGLNSDIYGKKSTLKFLEFVRKEERFSDTISLINAVKSDIKTVLGIDINI